VASVDDAHREVAQPAHGGDVRLDVAALELVEQRAVVDRVTREQHAAGGLPESDAAGGVAGEVEHLERAVAEVDDIVVGEQCGRRRGGARERGTRHPACGHGVDQEVGDVVAGVEVRPTDRLAESGGIERDRAGRTQLLRLRRMDGSPFELVETAHVIAVHMCRHGEHLVAELVLDEVPQRPDAERRVDHEVEIATTNVPHVAPQERVDVRLGDQGDPVVDAIDDEPRVGNGQIEHGTTVAVRRGTVVDAVTEHRNFHQLPDPWPSQRDTLQRIATHVLGQARFRHDGLFDLVPLPGGFGTPVCGPARERVRLVGGSLFVERVTGDDVRSLMATTDVVTVAGSSINELCAAIGFDPDPSFRVGITTPELGDPDELLMLDSLSAQVLGEWYLLGQRAIDEVVASLPAAEATVGRLWPEHFDYGIDVAARPGVRCNLGAAAGDGFSAEPYLYLGPWAAARPGSTDYWNASFGAMIGFADLDESADPLGRAVEFLLQGIIQLRSS
jgi:hypothetical protein